MFQQADAPNRQDAVIGPQLPAIVPRMQRILFFALAIVLAGCASSTPSHPADPFTQRFVDDRQAFIGKNVWFEAAEIVECDDPTTCDIFPIRASQRGYIGPFLVKDVVLSGPPFNHVFMVATTADGSTKYLYSASSTLAREASFEDPKITAARKKTVCDKKGSVSVGMTESNVLASCWGKPSKRNVTETASGHHEQWVYGTGNYLYFDNGILLSIQTSQ